MPRVTTFPKSYINFSAVSYQKEHKIKNQGFDIWEKRELIFAGIFILALIFFYAFQINLTVEKNYQIRNFENQISQLQSDNQKLTVEALALENTQLLAEEASSLGLEENNDVEYVKITASALASSR